jgi:hypothetical protein
LNEFFKKSDLGFAVENTALAFFIVVAISQIYPLLCKDKN